MHTITDKEKLSQKITELDGLIKIVRTAEQHDNRKLYEDTMRSLITVIENMAPLGGGLDKCTR